MRSQATLDMLKHINWKLVLGKLQGMNIDKRDIIQVMKIFQWDESFTRVFMSLTIEEYMHDSVFEKLDRDPLQLLFDVNILQGITKVIFLEPLWQKNLAKFFDRR